MESAPGSWVIDVDVPAGNRAKQTSEMDSLTPRTPTHQFSLWVLVVVVGQNGGGGVGSGREARNNDDDGCGSPIRMEGWRAWMGMATGGRQENIEQSLAAEL